MGIVTIFALQRFAFNLSFCGFVTGLLGMNTEKHNNTLTSSWDRTHQIWQLLTGVSACQFVSYQPVYFFVTRTFSETVSTKIGEKP